MSQERPGYDYYPATRYTCVTALSTCKQDSRSSWKHRHFIQQHSHGHALSITHAKKKKETYNKHTTVLTHTHTPLAGEDRVLTCTR